MALVGDADRQTERTIAHVCAAGVALLFCVDFATRARSSGCERVQICGKKPAGAQVRFAGLFADVRLNRFPPDCVKHYIVTSCVWLCTLALGTTTRVRDNSLIEFHASQVNHITSRMHSPTHAVHSVVSALLVQIRRAPAATTTTVRGSAVVRACTEWETN